MATRLTLHVLRGTTPGQEYVFDAPSVCKIGRAAECEVRLPNSWEYLDVSRRHCLITILSDAVRVRDLGSRNGTYLNGTGIGRRDKHLPLAEAPAELTEHQLTDGDELQVGDTVFRVDISRSRTGKGAEVPLDAMCGFGPVPSDGSAFPAHA